GILNWAIKGAMDWFDHRFTIPAKCRQAVDAIRTDKDRIAEFLAAECVKAPRGVIQASRLWERYRMWYGANYPSGSMMSSKTFYQTLEDHQNIEKSVRSEGTFYLAYAFRPEPTTEERLKTMRELQQEALNDHLDRLQPPPHP